MNRVTRRILGKEDELTLTWWVVCIAFTLFLLVGLPYLLTH
jgi:hypothetical protein